MRVLFVANGIDRPKFGAQSASRQLLDEMLSQSDIEFIIYPAIEENWIAPTRKRFLSGTSVDHIRWMYTSSRAVGKLCRKNNVDLVHIQSYGGYATLPPNHVPSLITLHDEPNINIWDYVSPPYYALINAGIRRIGNFLISQMIKRNPCAIALCSLIKRQLQQMGLSENRIQIIPNGVGNDDAGLPPIPHLINDITEISLNSRIVLSVGSLIFEKGLHKEIMAAKMLQKIDPSIHFVRVGAGNTPLARGYMKRIRQWLKVDEVGNFHWIGYLQHDTVMKLMQTVDMYLSASYTESFGLSLVEAMITGLPIICTDVGIARDFLKDDSNTIILDRYCTPRQIAGSVTELLERGVRKESKRNPPSWKDVARDTIGFYYRIIDNTQNR